MSIERNAGDAVSNKRNPQNLITIRRSNKLIQALNLPKVLVLNPRIGNRLGGVDNICVLSRAG